MYDGSTSQREFLQLCSIAIVATGGDDKSMDNWVFYGLETKCADVTNEKPKKLGLVRHVQSVN
jgi:hypothetical protein